MTSLVACKERESCCLVTAEVGVLRDEWKIENICDCDPSDLIRAFGEDWRRYSPNAEVVLLHRYIRRGKIESWAYFQTANTFDQALGYIDDKAIPLCEELKKIQADRIAYRAECERKEKEENDRRIKEEEKYYHWQRSQKAFERLLESKDSVWAGRWNNTISLLQKKGNLADLQKDSLFMQLYNAVMDSETVPGKRKAIKNFLKYVDERK